MSNMRGLDTQVRAIRRRVFKEVAKLGFEANSETLLEDMEAIPYEIVNDDTVKYRESTYRSRAIVRERLRLAMGLSLRPEDKPVHLTAGVQESNISEKYYEPPLMQVIPSACESCEENKYEVSNMCKGCLAHPCSEVCPKGAISMVNGKSYIDQEKCIKCGRCVDVCAYHAIIKQERPCAAACGMDAIHTDKNGKAEIDYDKCVSCGQCLVNCPFGAIADKSQIFQVIRAIQAGERVYAAVAPAFVGQFGPKVTPGKLRAAMKQLGFADVFEVAVGADLCAAQEAEDFIEEVPEKLPFMGTSCCPAWSMMAKKMFPEYANCISMALTPMTLTARLIKHHHQGDAKVAFIGPCAAKKLEAMRKDVRSEVDFVLTFEEMVGIFDARHVDLESLPEDPHGVNDASTDGRNFAVSGGVANAVVNVIKEKYPDREVKITNAEGLRECRKMMMAAKAGKFNGYLLEGMACPGGCVAGAGTMQPIKKSAAQVGLYAKQAEHPTASGTEYVKELDKLID